MSGRCNRRLVYMVYTLCTGAGYLATIGSVVSRVIPSTIDCATRRRSALGPKFDVLKFHDFILSQGLLPPALLRKAVLEGLAH